MSLKEYKEQEEERQEEAKKSLAHYAALNLPGTRTTGVNKSEAKARLDKMKAERNKPDTW